MRPQTVGSDQKNKTKKTGKMSFLIRVFGLWLGDGVKRAVFWEELR